MFSKLEAQNRDDLVHTTRQLLVDVQALSSRIAAVQEMATAINRSLDIEQILAVISQHAKWILDFDSCSICLLKDDQQTELRVLSDLTASALLPDATIVSRAIETRQPQLCHHLPAQMVIPLESEQVVLGTINFVSQKVPRYTQDDIRIGYLLAVQLASAIRNARRFAKINQLYDELREAEQLRDSLMHMLVHDMRSPLSIILNYLDLIDLQSDDAEVHQFVTPARLSGERMLGMIEDLLLVRKFETGEFHPRLEPLSLKDLLLATTTTYQLLEKLHRQHFEVQLTENLPIVWADYRLISRVTDNLLSNAFKYSTAGGYICLSARVEGDEVIVAINDNGIGIASEDQDSIFDKFAQIKHTHQRTGVGLGLAFCRLVIEAHFGRIWVESEPNKGSTFFFSLPIANNP